MAKIQEQDVTEVIEIMDQMVQDFERETKLKEADAAAAFQAFEENFESFATQHFLEIAEMVKDSELEQSDKIYFIYLLFNGLFTYEQYQLLQDKLSQKTAEIKLEEAQLLQEIEELEAQQKKLEEGIFKGARAAHQAFSKQQHEMVETGLKTIEAGKKTQESAEVEAIKEKLKKK